jgi:murein L,D-transpeptidase YafK
MRLNKASSIIDVLRCSAIVATFALVLSAHADDDLSVEASSSKRQEAGLPVADAIVVRKSARHMELIRRGQVLRSYKIQLGLRPLGAKEEEGDFRTPEGRYRLARRNARSDYFLSIEISYPNDSDVARAKRLRVKPGGNIMIHGVPNLPRKTPDYYAHVDWTDGCIAVSNPDMVEIWLMTRPDTPIEILP